MLGQNTLRNPHRQRWGKLRNSYLQLSTQFSHQSLTNKNKWSQVLAHVHNSSSTRFFANLQWKITAVESSVGVFYCKETLVIYIFSNFKGGKKERNGHDKLGNKMRGQPVSERGKPWTKGKVSLEGEMSQRSCVGASIRAKLKLEKSVWGAQHSNKKQTLMLYKRCLVWEHLNYVSKSENKIKGAKMKTECCSVVLI